MCFLNISMLFFSCWGSEGKLDSPHHVCSEDGAALLVSEHTVPRPAPEGVGARGACWRRVM